ncbi:pentachlorophenol monooxygenase [Subtercola boreus]|uniref:Pentachlorophenol monooxygenase n=1 Tax=Subtercola boreus TaxID=120213 RepID=A0A3E0VLG6_9MICO|nr:pentachlorophenol monooxygenase [Subtercola boreus]TQL55975.1 2-polyprenyl-6-methoxyphenol hydroxylase-like FAD-dependent oxidoreductase [Subtercola boreus]
MSESTETQVLIVGAGPAGLTTACALAQAGVDVVIIDALASGANTSRAAVVHARTLEVLTSLDVTSRMMAEGVVVPTFTVRDGGAVLARLDFSGLPTPYPFTLMLPQSRTEALLEHRLAELGVTVRRPVTLQSIDTESELVMCGVMHDDGRAEVIRARFVVGADGSHSRVRDAADIRFEGSDYEQSFVLADVTLSWPLPADEVQLFLAQEGLVVVAPLPGGRHRIVATVDVAPEHPSSSDVQRLLDERGPRGSAVHDIAWSSRFRVAHRLASSYRSGAVFLVGDAAHVHSPAGGQGMNTGIQDATDLAATLAAVIDGSADAASLDGYETRRRPVAAGVVALTDRMTRVATIRSPRRRQLRNAAIRALTTIPPLRRALTMRIAELR